jgi:hypothetical protein
MTAKPYPAEHYDLIDDKLRILTAVKETREPGNHRLSAASAMCNVVASGPSGGHNAAAHQQSA